MTSHLLMFIFQIYILKLYCLYNIIKSTTKNTNDIYYKDKRELKNRQCEGRGY